MLLQEFKIKAFKYQQKHKCKRNEALHAIAKESGFKNYNSYLGALKNKDKLNQNQPIPINMKDSNTGKTTMYKELQLPNSDLVKGCIPDNIKDTEITIIEDPMEKNIDYSIGNDSIDILKGIELLKNHFGYSKSAIPVWLPKPSVNKIPDEYKDNKTEYYYKTLKAIRQKVDNNMTLKNLVEFIFQYEAVSLQAMSDCIDMFICGCLGPVGDNPLCACRMKTVFKFHNIWFNVYKDIENKKICIKLCKRDVYHDYVFCIAKSNNQYVLTDL